MKRQYFIELKITKRGQKTDKFKSSARLMKLKINIKQGAMVL